jgi:hypothetical protein
MYFEAMSFEVMFASEATVASRTLEALRFLFIVSEDVGLEVRFALGN